MRAHSIRSERHQPAPLHNASQPQHTVAGYGSGIISEIDYSAEHPMTTLLLLPLLQQLAAQSRWLLWLAPLQKISRHWLQQSGLPLDKVIQPYHLKPNETVDAMEKALLTGNYSVVLCWLEHNLTAEESMRLRQAAQKGNAYGFIMRPQGICGEESGLFSRLKIHSTLYH